MSVRLQSYVLCLFFLFLRIILSLLQEMEYFFFRFPFLGANCYNREQTLTFKKFSVHLPLEILISPCKFIPVSFDFQVYIKIKISSKNSFHFYFHCLCSPLNFFGFGFVFDRSVKTVLNDDGYNQRPIEFLSLIKTAFVFQSFGKHALLFLLLFLVNNFYVSDFLLSLALGFY